METACKIRFEIEMTDDEYEEVMRRLDRMHSRREDGYVNFQDITLFDFISGKLRSALQQTYDGTDWRNCIGCNQEWPFPSVSSEMRCPRCSGGTPKEVKIENFGELLVKRWSHEDTLSVNAPFRRMANIAEEEIQKLLAESQGEETV